MATIDQYKHEFVDFIECPSDYNLVPGNTTRKLAIYQLLQDIPIHEIDFDGKKGDLIVGGGSGEVEALRISIPKAISYFTQENWGDFESDKDLFQAFWSPSLSFKLGNGFLKLGWDPKERLEKWLTERIINKVLENENLKPK